MDSSMLHDVTGRDMTCHAVERHALPTARTRSQTAARGTHLGAGEIPPGAELFVSLLRV